jgi:hypothetical protein
MKVEIKNIVLNVNRFRVYIVLENGVEENEIFMPEATSKDILVWVQQRLLYYQELKDKETQLIKDLANKEYTLEMFEKLYATNADFKIAVDDYKKTR